MIEINGQFEVRPDHISGVGKLFRTPNRLGVQSFEIYLIGGQTLTVSAPEGAVEIVRGAVVQAVHDLP
ncbi:hypothetical protein DBR33_06245 [Stenotrophomonas sp. HMWF022]|uniref:hypothetical protein n=1 Tax=Stenotrophomonas sp. HMWF023 TaxID=2056859 RepID=UPI000D3C535C|nr:hypothetical protein [Stenotrophomonas sp. HMWF023]PTS71906.1 hypothetical protein DBR20_20855 [Stenotrophomonas sp. HMWF023]PTT51320.1 hypothetical protein DBR33_06245 [Stenotrophomonas sp. HMWF022]